MSDLVHKDLGNTAAEMHGIVWQTVADAAALAALVIVQADIDQQRVVFQADTKQRYVPTTTGAGATFRKLVDDAALSTYHKAAATLANQTAGEMHGAIAKTFTDMPALLAYAVTQDDVDQGRLLRQTDTGEIFLPIVAGTGSLSNLKKAVFDTDAVTIMARARTTSAGLPAYTYANGTAGVGATITLNGGAALPAQDGVTLVAGEVLQVANGASFADNGPYRVVTANPGVLMRDTRCDSQNKILSAVIKIREGNTYRGALYEYINNPAITVGTTMLAWGRVDINRSLNEYAAIGTDFDMQVAALGNGTVMAGEWPGFVTLSGTASVGPKAVPTQDKRGVFTLSVTTTTASVALSFSGVNKSYMLDVSQHFELELSIAGPTALSDGTDTYRILAGLGSGAAVGNTDGVWVEYTQATSTKWLGVARTASASTTSGSSGPTVATTTYTRARLVKFAGETGMYVQFDGGALIALATNVPLNVALVPFIVITKSAGNVNARAFDIDYFRWVQQWPAGRA